PVRRREGPEGPAQVSRRRLLPTGAILAALVAAAALALRAAPGGPARAEPGESEGAAAPVAPKTAPDVAGAIRRGVAYLVTSQNKDGSWGSPASNLWDIYAPV